MLSYRRFIEKITTLVTLPLVAAFLSALFWWLGSLKEDSLSFLSLPAEEFTVHLRFCTAEGFLQRRT